MRRTRGILTLVCGSLFLAAGCGGPADQDAVTVTESRTVTEAPETTTDAVTTEATTDTAPAEGGRYGDRQLGTTFFVSPSGNIGCAMTRKSVRCDVKSHTYEDPEPPADCQELEYGDSITLNGDSAATWTCHGDTVFGTDADLPYGASITVGSFTCDSSEAGVTCSNTDSGHSFMLARERYELN